MLKKLTLLLLALLPFCTQLSWAQSEDDGDDEEPTERETNAEFQVGSLFYSVLDEERLTVTLAPQYYEESQDAHGYDKDKSPKGKVVVPQTITHGGKTYTVTQIEDETFENCVELTEIVLPESITSIGTSAFSRTGISSILLPKMLVSLGQDVFAGCVNLKELSIPETITQLNGTLLKGCISLQKLELPKTLKSIGNSAFAQCTSLEEITLPETLVSIDRHVFKDCDNLARVICLFSNPEQLKYLGAYGEIFEGTPKGTMTLFVPAGTKEAFAKIYPWNKKFKEIREIVPAGLSALNAEEARVAPVAQGLRITLSSNQGVKIYDLKGQQQLQSQLTAGEHTVALPTGLYIVKVGNSQRKIAVR